MASKLVQLKTKATQASQFVAKHGSVYYKQLLEQNKQYIQEPPTVEKCNLLAKQLFYTRLARSVKSLLFHLCRTKQIDYNVHSIKYLILWANSEL